MSVEVKVPTLGESITSASIATWRKQVGDAVQIDEVLVDLETEKVGIEVPSPVAGTIESIAVGDGDDVEIGALLCTIAEGKSQAKTTPAKTTPAKKTDEVKISPSAAKMARESGVSTEGVSGSGAKGHVLKEDIVKTSVPAPTFEPLGDRPLDARGEERVKMSKLRKVIATRLKQAQNSAALLTTYNEVDMTALMDMRSQYRDEFENKYNVKLGFMSSFVKAVVSALQENPAINAEIYGDEIIYKNYYDIGIAVGSPQGLVVPVLRDADKKNFVEIEQAIADFGRKARDGGLTIEEMTGGTFTITNGGVFGSLLSSPIINPPQSGILGMHKIQKRPICRGNEIVASAMMYLALSYDHRIIDGREAVTFLVRIKELLEDPARLLLNI